MTSEEAISLLSQVNHILVNSNSWLENTHEPLNIAFDMAIKALEQEPRWIPVSERLPKEYDLVLCWYEYFRYGDYNCMYKTYGVGFYGDGYWGGDVTGHKVKVFAWMPLPKAYSEVEE